MVKVFGANAVIGKNGSDEENPVQEFSEGKIASIRVGYTVFDPTVEGEKRWVNVTLKGFGTMAERLKKMNLKRGSNICFSGELDVAEWEKDGVKKTAPVIVLTDIRYQNGGGSKKEETYEVADEEEEKSPPVKSTPKKKASFKAYETDDGDIPF